MNGYHRMEMKVEPLKSISGTLCCDEIDYCNLPEDVLSAVTDCDTKKLEEYLKKGLDVNAQFKGQTLLWSACSAGKTGVVSLLLESPDLHLNIRFDGKTPLEAASCSGHLECVRLILNAQLKCRVQLKNGWRSITSIFKRNFSLNQDSMLWIFQWAGYCSRWDVVLLVIKTETYLPGEILYRVILKAIAQERWDIVCEIIKRKFNNKEDIVNEVFYLSVKFRKWEIAESIISVINEDLKLDLDLVEAALNGLEEEFNLLFSERRADSTSLNGCLLAVSAGGTSELIASSLMSVQNGYTPTTYSNALFLSSMGQNSEMFSALLSSPETDFTFHDLCRAHKALEQVSYFDYENFVSPFVKILDRLKEIKVKERNLFSKSASRTPQSYYEGKHSRRISLSLNKS